MHLKRTSLWIVLLTLFARNVGAQDIHYSQYYHNLANSNPALTGLYSGIHRVTALYRNQWTSVPVPYMSFGLFYDSKLRLAKTGDQIGLGIGFDYDRAGDSELSLTSINISVNYAWTIGKHVLSLGLNPNVGQRRLSEEKLKWHNQWNGDRYDPNLSPRETFAASGKYYVDLAGGLAYTYYLHKRTKFQLGAALYHLLQPNETFYGIQNTTVELPIRNVFQFSTIIGIGSFLDLILQAQHQTQITYKESVGSGILRLYVNKNPGIKLNILLGVNYRLDDAIIPSLGIEYKDWLISGTYDINTSPFKTVTNKKGGPEIALQYIFKNVEPIGIYKKCPIY